MIGIPYQRIVFQSQLQPVLAVARLKTDVTERRWLIFLGGDKEFVGHVTSHGFRLFRNVRGRNFYLPWIIGTIQANGFGSQITIISTVHPAVAVLMVGLLVYAACTVSAHGAGILLTCLTVAAFVLLHLIMCVIGFNPEVERARTRLRELFGTD